ncbi:DUF2480 family protein [Tenacibaculum finnmarkense genomovar ulcerans]|uniref:DUF2480 family protein n=1 Tax=Tenacibaculum finnmarkense TaxID=2781243 RepID=UPI000738F329|nr:DUF2480 family protein [Tenacibaculum finnmarkense]ALU75929.1 hypothetical protein AUW17_12015 [Tenacibaculum dicentrarchi]MBE7633396.1 DUF2480 family protein [Tenacibaculum finnmarkense genomovar ulcerans]MBE7645029.1 DUF2480 family protein [Tenacibaculum finnmarkense genomovar ulcerans]MCD8429311.1 DUF2480 family protein [Tenacibaculum finnmarkense genomovar ulcerans]MCG8794706.1 DUF2480 family protein [Tenacibaculum finnmarkense]
MAAQIINKVANSQLITIDLEDFYPKGNRIVFDIKDWLYEELILREKDFREQVKNHNWSQYQGDYIALSCSVEAIIPSWAYLLLTTKLTEFAQKVVVGNLELLETVLFNDIITNLNITEYQDKRLIIKGCSNKPIPQSAYTLLVSKIQPICKSIMFGEACSTVPLFKKK